MRIYIAHIIPLYSNYLDEIIAADFFADSNNLIETSHKNTKQKGLMKNLNFKCYINNALFSLKLSLLSKHNEQNQNTDNKDTCDKYAPFVSVTTTIYKVIHGFCFNSKQSPTSQAIT